MSPPPPARTGTSRRSPTSAWSSRVNRVRGCASSSLIGLSRDNDGDAAARLAQRGARAQSKDRSAEPRRRARRHRSVVAPPPPPAASPSRACARWPGLGTTGGGSTCVSIRSSTCGTRARCGATARKTRCATRRASCQMLPPRAPRHMDMRRWLRVVGAPFPSHSATPRAAAVLSCPVLRYAHRSHAPCVYRCRVALRREATRFTPLFYITLHYITLHDIT